MKLTLIVLALALTAFAVPTHADDFRIKGAADFSVADFSPNAPFVTSLGTVETFSTSFIYDPASLSTSDMSFAAHGLIGSNFSFTGVTDNGGQTIFHWSGADAIITADVPDFEFNAKFLASFGMPEEVGDNIFLACLTQKCSSDFVFPDTDLNGVEARIQQGSTFISLPSTVPEPSSLSLLGSGLLIGAFLMRRKLPSVR